MSEYYAYSFNATLSWHASGVSVHQQQTSHCVLFFPVHGTFCAVTEKRPSLLPTSVNKLKKEAKKVEKKVIRLQQLTIRQDFPYQIFSIFDR